VTAPDAQPASFGPTAASTVLAPAPGFVCLPRAVLRAPGLSVLARLLYAVLRDYAREDGYCFPSVERLRADVAAGHNQLARALRELEAGGLVARRRRGFGRTTVYQLLPLPTRAGAADRPRPPRRALPRRSLEALLGVPRTPETPGASGAPRSRRPERPDPAPLTDPDRVPQDQDSGDRDAEDQQQPPPPVAAPAVLKPRDGAVVALLVEQGVTRRVAEELADRYPAEVVRRQVDCHRHRVAGSGLSRNPAGALVRAIREDWAPPAAWASARSSAALRAGQAEEEHRRREEEEQRRRAWAAKPPEERIAGRLQFWLMGHRVKGHEPGEAEVAARRAELLAELASRDRGTAPRWAPGAAG
jgi:hypothetical protein